MPGPNGAGKTTLAEILEGFRTGWSGEVAEPGENPARWDACRRPGPRAGDPAAHGRVDLPLLVAG